jgi:uncharacterized protein (DUF2345 family)
MCGGRARGESSCRDNLKQEIKAEAGNNPAQDRIKEAGDGIKVFSGPAGVRWSSPSSCAWVDGNLQFAVSQYPPSLPPS